MAFKKFHIGLAVRLATVLIAFFALCFLLLTPGYVMTSVLAAIISVMAVIELYSYLSRTNKELIRFLDAVKFADYGQSFRSRNQGGQFDELGSVLSASLAKLRENRSQVESDLAHLKAVIEHAPIPLMSAKHDGTLKLWNAAARRLIDAHNIHHVEDLSAFGEMFASHIKNAKLGTRQLVEFHTDDTVHQLTVNVTQVQTRHHKERLFSLQDIQSELDNAQLEAWEELVKVLTHEIMNSITPVASLAKTSADLADEIFHDLENGTPVDPEDLDDLKGAIETVARRSDGLYRFVSNYREMTQLPPLNKEIFKLEDLFAATKILTRNSLTEQNVKLVEQYDFQDLELKADPDLVEQILINLIKNAAEAFQDTPDATITLVASKNRKERLTIDVIDNGSGIPTEIAEQIFVPFYTTKQGGSGVGLALARQIMKAHGGDIRLLAASNANTDQSGAHFRLTF